MTARPSSVASDLRSLSLKPTFPSTSPTASNGGFANYIYAKDLGLNADAYIEPPKGMQVSFDLVLASSEREGDR